MQVKLRCPALTPPTVSGVSCAPLEDREGIDTSEQQSKEGRKKAPLSKIPVLPCIREQNFHAQTMREDETRADLLDPGKNQLLDLQSMVAKGHALRLTQDDSMAVMLFKEINDCSDESRG